ncbi:MAG TPA: protoporphyrinogen oxidase [Terriglobales bacterium]|jgi:oxygen-dependent protoporphyrinogen oxidase|nr:protoporphyrinogen oxidase [Terriglobales bacterium]
MKRIAIIGGGISGLSAAYTLEEKRQSGTPVQYALFESSPRLGGVLLTDRVDGCLIEAGPDSFLTEKPWAADLCRKVGLGDQLVGSNDADRKTYILVKGKLVELPDGLMFMVATKIMPTLRSPLFSVRTKLRMAAEWFHLPHKTAEDETVAQMVERHYGPEMVELLADPLLSGVYGGEASQLSARAVLPRFTDMESKHGSLGRAVLSASKKMGAVATTPPRPVFTSLKNGMQQMVNALVANLDARSLLTSAPVQSLIPQNNGWTVCAGYQTDHFDAIIIATPAQAAASVLASADDDLSRELGEIRYSSSVTVTLGYDEKVRASLPPGFGFLVPRGAGHRMLAATFVHNKFSYRAPANRALIRCFLGGTRDEEILQASEEEILRIVRGELRQIISLNAEPLFARVYKWKSAMAQYVVGHLERLQRIEVLRQKLHGLALAGNGYGGIGVPDCVRSGAEAAGKILAEMGMWSSA